MTDTSQPPEDPASLSGPDWSALPVPQDDGAAAHLAGMRWPALALPATGGANVELSSLPGLSVVYAYPRTGVPGQPMPEGWDAIPGARGCTPQSCAYRDHFAGLRGAGADHVFGLSTQSTPEQQEAAARLHLPYPLLSDAEGSLTRALRLPVFEAGGAVLLKRLTMIVEDGVIAAVFYPVFPPDADAPRVLAWLEARA